jgi:hypothetical protein
VTPSQVMHYLPQGHRAETRAVPDLRPGLKTAAFGQPHVGAAPVIIVVAAVPDRTQRKYGTRAEAFVQLEAGHAAQNILLQAAARGLAAVPVGSLDPSRAAVTLALPPVRPSCTSSRSASPRNRIGRTRQSARSGYAHTDLLGKRLPRRADITVISRWTLLRRRQML